MKSSLKIAPFYALVHYIKEVWKSFLGATKNFFRNVLNSFCYQVVNKCVLLWTSIFRSIKVIHKDRLNCALTRSSSQGIIYICNHPSRSDPFILSTISSRTIHFFATEELLCVSQQRSRFMEKSALQPKLLRYMLATCIAYLTRFLIANSHTILVNRNSVNARENRLAIPCARKLLENGKVLGIFPEGGTERNDYSPIAYSLAKKTNALLIPLYIEKIEGKWNVYVGHTFEHSALSENEDPGQFLAKKILEAKQTD